MNQAVIGSRVSSGANQYSGARRVPTGWLWLSLVVLLAFGAWLWIQNSELANKNSELAKANASQAAEIVQLKTRLAASDQLRAENARLKRVVDAEVAQKNAFAVEITKLKGRITQGERDHGAALDKLRVLEKKVPQSRGAKK